MDVQQNDEQGNPAIRRAPAKSAKPVNKSEPRPRKIFAGGDFAFNA